MGIKLFFKHLFNSINKRKAQPLLLVIVIAIAVVVCISTINLKIFTVEDVDNGNYASYGEADFVVSVNVLSPRFIFVDDAKKHFADKADVCGVFSLPIFYGDNNDFIYGVATNYNDINSFFDIQFYDYQVLYDYQVSSGAFISKKLADKYGFSVGDKIDLNILSIDFTYVIHGIADNMFFDEYDIMVDTSSILDYVERQTIGVQAFGPDLDIANQVYFNLKVNDENFETELKTYYKDMKVSSVDMLVGMTYGINEVIILMIFAIIFFVFCVIYCCCYIIATQRVEETNLFYLVGAKPYMLNTISMCELALYWLVGSVFGIFSSYPLGQYVIDLCSLTYSTNAFSPSAIAVSVICIFIATEGSLLIYILTDWIMKKRQAKKKTSNIKLNSHSMLLLNIIAWSIVIILTVVSYFMPKNIKWYVSLTDFIAFILATTISSKCTCLKLPDLLLRNKNRSAPLRYALKNVQKENTLSNLSVIVSILIISVMSIIMILECFNVSMNKCRYILNGDYLLMSATETSIEKIRENENVESVISLLKENVPLPYKDTGRFDIYSTTDKSVFQGLFTLDELPEGNEVFIFGMYADSLGLEVGDTFTLEIGQKEMDLVFKKKLPINTNGIILDAEALEIPYNYTVIKGNGNLTHEELYDEIMKTLALDNVLVVDADQINESFIDSNSYAYYCCLFMLVVVLLFSLVGIFDNIASSYRSRNEEFYSYSCAGMNKMNLFRMKFSELAYSISCGITIGLLLTPLAFFIIYEVGLSQGINFVWLLR